MCCAGVWVCAGVCAILWSSVTNSRRAQPLQPLQWDILGEDILRLWRCVILRRRILVVADRADVAVRTD